jgi:TolB protein
VAVRAACLALALAFAAGCGHGGRPEGVILFQSDRGGPTAIYSVRPDGTRLGRLALGSNLYFPGPIVPAPDGRRFFVPFETGKPLGYVIDTTTGTWRPLRVHDLGGESWSPDGERLAVAAERGILVIDHDGSHRRQLTRNPAHAEPAWSPDGKRIAYSTDTAIYTVSAKGGRPSFVARLAYGVPTGPRWSHDGRWISFTRGAETKLELFVVHPDGSGRRRLATYADEVKWSPRDDTLVYVAQQGIYRVDVDGKRPRRLAFSGSQPTWSPDGERIAYVRPELAPGLRDPSPEYQLWVMNADGSGKRPVTSPFPSGGSNQGPTWVAEDVKPARPASRLRPVSLPQRFFLETDEPIGGLGAAGNHAVVEQGLGSATEYPNPPRPLLVWEPKTRRVRRLPVHGCGSVVDVVVADAAVAYTCDNSGVDVIERALRVQPLKGGRPSTLAHAVAANAPPGSLLSGVAGRGPLLAFGIAMSGKPIIGGFEIARTRLSVIVAGRAVPLRTWPRRATVVSTDGRRIVVLLGQRAVAVVAGETGRELRTLAFGRNRVQDAAVDGRLLFVMLRHRLAVYDVLGWRRIGSWPMKRGFGPQPILEDALGDLAVYRIGIALHVFRVSDGREFVIRIPEEAGPVFARLVPDGLFYAYNRAYAKPPGRVVFVPRSALLGAVRR